MQHATGPQANARHSTLVLSYIEPTPAAHGKSVGNSSVKCKLCPSNTATTWPNTTWPDIAQEPKSQSQIPINVEEKDRVQKLRAHLAGGAVNGWLGLLGLEAGDDIEGAREVVLAGGQHVCQAGGGVDRERLLQNRQAGSAHRLRPVDVLQARRLALPASQQNTEDRIYYYNVVYQIRREELTH